MTHQNEPDDDTAFSRTGVTGPNGPLTEPLKTFVDFETDAKFRQLCNKAGSDPSGVLRDSVYLMVHGKPYSQLVAEASQRRLASVFGEGLDQVLIGAGKAAQGGAQ